MKYLPPAADVKIGRAYTAINLLMSLVRSPEAALVCASSDFLRYPTP